MLGVADIGKLFNGAAACTYFSTQPYALFIQDTRLQMSKSMIQAKFSGSLRRQPAWRSLRPILFSSETYSFQGSLGRRPQSMLTGETEHDTIPFDVALPSFSHTDSILHVLLLWSSDDSKHNLERLQSRVPKTARQGDHQVALLVGNDSLPHDEQHIWQQFSILQDP